MVRSRVLTAVRIIVMCGVSAHVAAQSNAENVPKPNATAVLDKVRDTYRNVAAYHFERILLAQESGADGKLATIAELALSLATEKAKPAPEGEPFPAISLDRFRLGTKTKQGEMLQLCDGRTCWSYTSLQNEYMTGSSFRDVNTSVGGSMLMGLHLFTFSLLQEGTVQDAKVVREEEIRVGEDRRRCYVIEGNIQIAPLTGPGGSTKPPNPASLGASWPLMMLSLQGLSHGERGTRYSPWSDENAPGVGEATRVTLWIDRQAHIVVRSRLASQLYKRSAATGYAAEKLAVTLTDSFTTAAVDAPPDDLFHFTPPPGAKEVPNAASRRDKKE